MALVGKPGTEDIYEIPDTEVEKARGKGYRQYFDVTKDDKNTFTVAEDELEKAKAKGYRLFGQPQAPAAKTTEEPSWLSRAAESAVETVKGAPAGLYQLGKEVVTQPAEAIPAALTGAAKTLGVGAVGGALRGGYEAGKALLTGEEVQPAFKRGYEAEVSGLEERAKRAKEVSPAAYAAGPYAATAAITGGASLPATLAAETATGAAQQLAETGKINTAELAGQAVAGGALMGAPSAAKTGLKGAQEAISAVPSALKKAAVESVPEPLRPAAREMAESPEAMQQYGTAEYELKKPGGLEEQWGEQKGLINDAIEELKKTQSEQAANALSEAANKGLERQKQKSTKLYELAYDSMNDQLDVSKSEAAKVSSMYADLDARTKDFSPKTNRVLERIITDQADQASIGGYTTGKELKNLVDLDQTLNSDISSLYRSTQVPGAAIPEIRRSINQLEGLKQEVSQRINSKELNLPKEVADQYKLAKDAYKNYATAKNDLETAKVLVKQKIGGMKKTEATAGQAYKALAPKIEDYTKTSDIINALEKLPGGQEGTPAMTSERFTELKQQAAAKVTPEQVMTPEQKTLRQRVLEKSAQASEYAELAKPRQEFIPGKIGLIQKAVEKVPVVNQLMGGSPVARISRAQAVEQAFKVPGLSFAVKVLENVNKPITSAIIRSLARQHNVDPAELENVLAEQPPP